jgi:hypothetical protein
MKKVSYNYGAIRDSVAKLSSIELMREGKSDTLNSFVKKTNESSNLKKQQLIYKNIQECKPFKKERLAERFLNQNLSIFRNSNWHDLIHENKEIRYDFLGAPDVSHVEARENGELFEAINTLIESMCNKGFSDFEAESHAYDLVMEHLTREVEEGETSEEEDDAPGLNEAWEFITKLAVSNFNKRYSHLNESEKEVLSVLLSGTKDKEEYLGELKNENLEKINSLLEGEDIDKPTQDVLMNFKEKVERISVVAPNEIDDYILECIELKQSLNEL